MSNTANVTPYRNEQAGADAGAAIGWALGALAEALAATDAEREVIARYRHLSRGESLGAARLDCRLADNGDLLAAAAGLGFRARGTDGPARLDAARLDVDRPIELLSPGGASLVIRRTRAGLAILSTGGQAPINDVVRQVTVGRAERHLAALSGGQVVSRRLASGEIELRAREARPRQDGAATITTRIAATGAMQVDVADLRGRRCEQLLGEVAQAVGGEIDGQTLKPAYYAAPVAPGEPVHIGTGG